VLINSRLNLIALFNQFNKNDETLTQQQILGLD